MAQELREMPGSSGHHPLHHQLEAVDGKEGKVHGGMLHALSTGHGQHDGSSCEEFHSVEEGPCLPDDALLQRVDRLDEMISTLEDKTVPGRSWSTPCSSPGTPPGTMAARGGRRSPTPLTPSSLEKRCKPTEAVLEEVEEKGTLVERITFLEMRVSELDRSLQVALSKSLESRHHHSMPLTTIPSFDPPSEQDDGAVPDPNAIEKHEVAPMDQTEGHKDANLPTGHLNDHLEDTNYRKDIHEGMHSTSWPTTPNESHKHSARKSKRFGQWLSKRFHMSSPSHEKRSSPSHEKTNHQGGDQGKNVFDEPHCWNLNSRSRRRNFKRGSLHPSQDTHSEADD